MRLAWMIRLAAHTRLFKGMAARLAFSGIAQAARDLQPAVGSLQEASDLLDSLFANLPSTLERLAGAAAELVERGQRMVRMASGQDTGRADFSRTISVLGMPLAYLASAREEMCDLSNDLRGAMETVGRLLTTQQELERAIAPLRYTQAMFSIESARLPEEARRIFAGLTGGIGVLNEKVHVSFSGHFQTLLQTHACLSQTVESLDRQSQEQVQDLRSKHEQIHQSLSRLTEELQNNRSRDVQLTKASAQLAHEVNQAVVGMQTQDIVSQKLAHARAGLEEALHAVAACRNGDMLALQKVPTVARIEAAQMDALVQELEQGGEVLRGAVGAITGQLERLDSECLMLREFKEITASVNGTIQVLLDILADVREMVGTTLSMTAATADMIRPVGAAAASLTNTVEGVAQEMRLIALNAQIQAIQIGSGTGLEVLAAHTAEISRSITDLGAKVALDLAETAAKVANDIGRLDRMRELGDREISALTSQGAAEESSLHEFRDQMLQEVRRVGELLDEAQKCGAGMLSSIDLSPAAKCISEVTARVANLVEAGVVVELAFSGSNAATHAASLERSYTMASEREVHRDTLQELGHCDLPEEPSLTAVGESSGGVELF